MLDAFECVGKYDAAIAEANLEDWSVLFGQARSDFGMLIAELEEVAEERDTWNFRKILDLGMIGIVQELDDEVANGKDRERDKCAFGHDLFLTISAI